ncbi:MAG: glycosyltransferase family 4 protein [Deltaproteobacteria bacterium]|nr:glycosyltransferase family 4 protein [Deltaproteobacteria bacterium]MBW2154579.1 glycosyltransferase family 4 protein [Deltaproteobacteria bacterium]
MNICFYAPFKPLDHPDPSGDQVIGAGLYDYLQAKGHRLWTVSRLRCRWVFLKPWMVAHIIQQRKQASRFITRHRPDLWLTYHTYYKGPDVLGPAVCQKTGVCYVIFQGVYASRRKRSLKTWSGYMLNKKALDNAAHVFTNKTKDFINLKRILPDDRLTYVAPGIFPEHFPFSDIARSILRQSWGVGNDPVILSAAMFRSDVKTQGLSILIQACGKLLQKGMRFHLVIAGDGSEKNRLLKLARDHLYGRVRFVGKIPRKDMYRFYSAGDLFAFPGIRESLGMVYLEAQCCGIPAIAFANEGTPQVINHLKTGLLVPAFDESAFIEAMKTLIDHSDLRLRMGRAAKAHVLKYHDLNKNYEIVETVLSKTAYGHVVC